MNLSDLLSKDLVEKFQSRSEQIKTEITNAEKHLKSAQNVFDADEWGYAYSAAYNAMLCAGRALMFSKGYRPQGREHHLAVVSFSQIYEAKYLPEVLAAFSNARKRRSEFQYDDADAISEGQVRNLIKNAKVFVSKTKELLKL